MKILAFLALLGMSMTASSKNIVELDIPDSFSNKENIDVQPFGSSQIYLLSKESEGIKLSIMKKNSSGVFSESTNRELNPESLNLDGYQNLSMLDSGVDNYGLLLLASSSICDGNNQCKKETTLIAINDSGELDTRRGGDGFESIDHSDCLIPPNLWVKDVGAIVWNSCSEAISFDENLKEYERAVIRDELKGEDVNFTHDPFFGVNDAGELEPKQVNLSVSLVKNGMITRYTLNDDMTTSLSSDVSINSGEICTPIAGTTKSYHCSDDDFSYLYDEQRKVDSFKFTPSEQIGSDKELSYEPVSGVWFYDDHYYFYNQVKNDNGDNEKTQVSNVGINQENYSVNLIDSNENGDYKISNTGSFSVSLVEKSGGKKGLVVFDNLYSNSPPTLLKGLGGVVYSNSPIEQVIYYQDEESVYEDIDFSLSENPEWITFERNEAKHWVMKIAPYHDDIEELSVDLELKDGDGNESEYPIEVKSLQTPLQLMIYEKSFFEGNEDKSPIPISAFIDALNQVPIIEDETYTFELSLLGRKDDEVSVSFNDLPEFAAWNADTKQLVVRASQLDVGDKAVNITLVDSYSNSPTTISLPLNVIEVDEPPVFISTPITNAVVGGDYNYPLSVSDEETGIEELDVNLITNPEWMSLNVVQGNFYLQGIPTKSSSDSSLVQISMKDSAGHLVLQTFEVKYDVVDDEVEDKRESGAVSLFLFVLALVVSVFRVRENEA